MVTEIENSNLEKLDHDGIRTHNLLIRSQAPYPLGHGNLLMEEGPSRSLFIPLAHRRFGHTFKYDRSQNFATEKSASSLVGFWLGILLV